MGLTLYTALDFLSTLARAMTTNELGIDLKGITIIIDNEDIVRW